MDDLCTVEMIYPADQVDDFVVVRKYDDSVKHIRKKGSPSFISFDNDPGLDDRADRIVSQALSAYQLQFSATNVFISVF